MIRYIAKRLLAAIPVLLVVAVAVFVLTRVAPGDPAAIMLGSEATPEEINELREQMGLNQPLIVQFFTWFGGLLTGDLGYSAFLKQNVSTAIATHFWPTLQLALMAEIIAIIVAVAAGVTAARRKGTWTDQTFMLGTLLGISIPSFLLGLFLVLIFAVGLHWLPAAGYVAPTQNLAQFLTYLILPAIALAAMQCALIARMTRASMLEVLGANYVKAARAKGVPTGQLVYRHALRNAAIPILTVIGQSFGTLLTGAIVIESVFNIPGIGQLVINSVERRDFALIQGTVIVCALIYVLINLLVDVAYGFLDPRVRLMGDRS